MEHKRLSGHLTLNKDVNITKKVPMYKSTKISNEIQI
jgi:hypothetical protein